MLRYGVTSSNGMVLQRSSGTGVFAISRERAELDRLTAAKETFRTSA